MAIGAPGESEPLSAIDNSPQSFSIFGQHRLYLDAEACTSSKLHNFVGCQRPGVIASLTSSHIGLLQN